MTESCGKFKDSKQEFSVRHSWLELLVGRKRAGKVRSVSQGKKNQIGFHNTAHRMPVRPVLRNSLGSPPCYQAYPTPCWWKPGARNGKPHSKGFLKESSQCSHAFLPPWEEGAATAEEAVHGLPAMGPLLASLSQVIWASNINKSSLRPCSVSHASCDSLCTRGLNTRTHHLPLLPCTSSLQTSVQTNLHSAQHSAYCALQLALIL